ncbi:MAG: hypothetical protein HWE20_10970 [Gammaproteobacteria bacterium]|nr:hypothetical protein [Gammaproteobacteria bacterium]
MISKPRFFKWQARNVYSRCFQVLCLLFGFSQISLASSLCELSWPLSSRPNIAQIEKILVNEGVLSRPFGGRISVELCEAVKAFERNRGNGDGRFSVREADLLLSGNANTLCGMGWAGQERNSYKLHERLKTVYAGNSVLNNDFCAALRTFEREKGNSNGHYSKGEVALLLGAAAPPKVEPFCNQKNNFCASNTDTELGKGDRLCGSTWAIDSNDAPNFGLNRPERLAKGLVNTGYLSQDSNIDPVIEVVDRMLNVEIAGESYRGAPVYSVVVKHDGGTWKSPKLTVKETLDTESGRRYNGLEWRKSIQNAAIQLPEKIGVIQSIGITFENDHAAPDSRKGDRNLFVGDLRLGNTLVPASKGVQYPGCRGNASGSKRNPEALYCGGTVTVDWPAPRASSESKFCSALDAYLRERTNDDRTLDRSEVIRLIAEGETNPSSSDENSATIAELQQELMQVNSQLAKVRVDTATAVAAATDLEAEFTRLQEELASKGSDVKQLEDSFSSIEAQLEKKNAAIDDLLRQLEDEKTEVKNLQQKKDSLVEGENDSERTNIELELQEKRKQLEQLQNTLRLYNPVVEKASNEVKDLQSQIEKLKADYPGIDQPEVAGRWKKVRDGAKGLMYAVADKNNTSTLYASCEKDQRNVYWRTNNTNLQAGEQSVLVSKNMEGSIQQAWDSIPSSNGTILVGRGPKNLEVIFDPFNDLTTLKLQVKGNETVGDFDVAGFWLVRKALGDCK